MHPAVKMSQTENGSDGLGLVASEDIPKGASLISLPDHLCLRFGPLQSDGGGCVPESVLVNLARQIPQELWAMKLGLKLLRERAVVGSFWWPYISNLPEAYSVPIFFSGEDIKNLQYAPILHQVNKRCRFLLHLEKEVNLALENLKLDHHPFGGQSIDASSLGWAMSAVSSRAFRLHHEKIHDGTQVDAAMMLPLIDMCNHSFNPNVQIVQQQDAKNPDVLVKVVAERQIKQNDPLLLNYGCLSNDYFLLDYGFVMPSNPYDCIELTYDGALLDAASMACGVMSANFSSPAPWQQEILSQLHLSGEVPDLKVSVGGPGLVDGRLLAALRVLLSGDITMVQKHDLDALKSLSAKAPLGTPTEIAAFRTIIAVCAIALQHFPTKVMEDESSLKEVTSESAKLAIQFRIQKKLLIVDAMKDLSRRITSLVSTESTTAQG